MFQLLRTTYRHPLGSIGLALLPIAAVSMALAAAPPLSKSPSSFKSPTYNQDVRPILAENCFSCHGPDSASRKAGLRLDRFADAILKRPSGQAIIPGDPVASRIMDRVRRPESDALHMPPAAGHKSLSPLQVDTLTRWIASGAKYEQHWSYLPIKRPKVPAVRNTKWVRNDIDRFTLAAMEARGLTPAPEADRRTLARRAAFDVTGLPPSPVDVEEFVRDPRPDAYDRYLNKLFASPRWGEHRGRYWLDAARYADTHGIHFDNYREIWAYRDWVINAFNENMPFDQFTVEQLAGDLLPRPTLDQRVATGFTRCNITTNEGGAIDEEYLVLYARDRTETTAQIWLGSTLGCAVCHDHKFDPITTRDFYAMSAFFNNTVQRAMDGNIKDTPPIIFVPSAADKIRFEQNADGLISSRAVVEERKKTARPDFETWLATTRKNGLSVAESAPDGQILRATLSTKGDQSGTSPSGLTSFTTLGVPAYTSGYPDGDAFVRSGNHAVNLGNAGDFDGTKPFSASVWVKIPGNVGGAVIAKMDEGADFRGWDIWLEDGKIGSHLINKWPENALKSVTRDRLSPNVWHHVTVTYDGSRKPSGLAVYVDGSKKPLENSSNSLTATIATNVPLMVGQRSSSAGAEGVAIQDVRIFNRVLPGQTIMTMASYTRIKSIASKQTMTEKETDELYAWWLTNMDASFRQAASRVTALEEEEAFIKSRGTTTFVASEKTSAPEAYVLQRGEYDKRRDKVSPATPASLPPMPTNAPKNRLGLAQWLLMPENPLPTRVTVNRFWQEVFGNGIVKSSGDFGITGELPTHPELLDWLATEFRRDNWDIKAFFRLMLTSATYRQASTVTIEKKRVDPTNKWLSRGPRFRMDAEAIRDTALSMSGLLSAKIGGPSVKPYQPDGVWEAVAMPESNTRNYKRDSGESLYRRSLYTFWKRAAPPASMEIFNAPNRETCVVKRERTNTPLQALVTLNDIQFVEAARVTATKLMREVGSTDKRMNRLSMAVLSRPWNASELIVLTSVLDDLKVYYKNHKADAEKLVAFGDTPAPTDLPVGDLAAWTMLCNQVLNLDEVLVK